MSYELVLEADVGSLLPGRRRRWFRDLPPAVHLDWAEGQEILDEQADWGETCFTLSARRKALARTVLAVAAELGPGWTLGSCWVGDELASEAAVTAEELADLCAGRPSTVTCSIASSTLRARRRTYRGSGRCGRPRPGRAQ